VVSLPLDLTLIGRYLLGAFLDLFGALLVLLPSGHCYRPGLVRLDLSPGLFPGRDGQAAPPASTCLWPGASPTGPEITGAGGLNIGIAEKF